MRPKVKAILRTRFHYGAEELISQFKTHVWGIMEVHNGAILHASNHLLERLDDIQSNFLHEIDVEEGTVFLKYNFAPPCLRRNIGMLGLLQKRVLGKAHPVFERLLPFHIDCFDRLRPGEHNRQLYNHFLKVHFQHSLFNRSVFGMVHVYNKLPQSVVESSSVSSFQRSLTFIAREACRRNEPKWKSSFACR